jgi:2-keto-3-deoxy-L-rhamnonate aldolase RhmA
MAPQADRLVNPVKARMQAGEVALGMPVRLARSGDIARIAKTTGHDFIFIDCQHSLFNIETIGHIAGAALAIGIAPLVRVRDSCLLVCMIETVEGLQNVEAIAAVEGVDVVHLGSNDLLANMGKPGKFDDPALVAAQERLIAACRKHGKYAGCGGNRDVQRQVDLVRKGCLFPTTQSDTGFLSAAASKWTAAIHDGLKA